MINFVNTGLDDRILKSMPVEDISEDLEKAMNKQGMVQKEVQVKGKNGTFTRKQWVRAGEEQKSDKTTQKSDSTNLKSNREVLTEKLKDKYGSKVTLSTIERSPKSDKGNNIAFLVRGYYKNLKGEVQHFYERMYIDSDSIPKSDNVSDPNMGKTLNVGTKKATVKSYDKLSIAEKREGADTIVSIGGKRYDYYSNMMANGIGSLVPHQDDPKIDMSAAQFKPGDKGMITMRSETIPVKVVDRATLNGKLMYLVQEDRPLAHGTPKKMYWTSDYNIKPIGGNKPDKSDKKDIKNSSGKSVGTVETVRDKSGRTMVIATKPDGTKKEFVNTANAKDKAERYLLNESNKTKSAQQPVAGQKLSPADAKKKTQEVTKGISDKKSFMEKAKAQGITWKENDHEGINWMRCCMALNKHFENGGEFTTDSSTKGYDKLSSSTGGGRKALDSLQSMKGWDGDGYSTGENDNDVYYAVDHDFDDANGKIFIKTTVGAMVDGDIDGGKEMTAQEVLDEINTKELPKKIIIDQKTFKIDSSSGTPTISISMYDTQKRLSKVEKYAKENGIKVVYTH